MNKTDAKIRHFQKQSADDPEDGGKRTDLIALYLEEGLLLKAIKEIKDTNENITKSLRLPESYHKPLIKLFGERGEIEIVEMIVSDLENNYEVEDDQTIKRMVRKGRRYIAKKYKVFPESMPLEDWWKDGPHLINESNLDSWFPGNMMIGEDHITVQMADRDEVNYLQVQTLELDFEEFKSFFEFEGSGIDEFLSEEVGNFFITEMGLTQKDNLIIRIYK